MSRNQLLQLKSYNQGKLNRLTDKLNMRGHLRSLEMMIKEDIEKELAQINQDLSMSNFKLN
jgi:hypothetical protein